MPLALPRSPRLSVLLPVFLLPPSWPSPFGHPGNEPLAMPASLAGVEAPGGTSWRWTTSPSFAMKFRMPCAEHASHCSSRWKHLHNAYHANEHAPTRKHTHTDSTHRQTDVVVQTNAKCIYLATQSMHLHKCYPHSTSRSAQRAHIFGCRGGLCDRKYIHACQTRPKKLTHARAHARTDADPSYTSRVLRHPPTRTTLGLQVRIARSPHAQAQGPLRSQRQSHPQLRLFETYVCGFAAGPPAVASDEGRDATAAAVVVVPDGNFKVSVTRLTHSRRYRLNADLVRICRMVAK